MKLIRISGLKFLILVLFLFSINFANTLIAGGWVAEQRNLSVMSAYANPDIWDSGPVEIATLEIDNNLPNYQLVLEFIPSDGREDEISEVHLQGLTGSLGSGLTMNGETILKPESGSRRFVWNPGPQQTATLDYQMRVLITYKQAPTTSPTLIVSMPSAY